MSFVGNVGWNFFKILLTLGAIAVGFYVIIEFKIWSQDWTDYFLRRGGWGGIIFVSLVAMGITTSIVWLLKWHIRLQGRG